MNISEKQHVSLVHRRTMAMVEEWLTDFVRVWDEDDQPYYFHIDHLKISNDRDFFAILTVYHKVNLTKD